MLPHISREKDGKISDELCASAAAMANTASQLGGSLHQKKEAGLLVQAGAGGRDHAAAHRP